MSRFVKKGVISDDTIVYFIDGRDFDYVTEKEITEATIFSDLLELDKDFPLDSISLENIYNFEGSRYANFEFDYFNTYIDANSFLVYSPQYNEWFTLPTNVAGEIIHVFEY